MKLLRAVSEVLVISALAVVAVIVCRQYVFNPYGIAGTSMAPSFHDGDYVLVDELSFKFREPRRGEVIVFHAPFKKNEDLLKRIIGLPDERVVVENGKVSINGLLLDEKYLDSSSSTNGMADITLGKDEYFVMGDNRPVSFDSRSWGVLQKKQIVGRVVVRVWPPDATKVFAAPRY